jgi:hypothetical protein
MPTFETTAGEKVEYGPIALDDLQLAQNAVEEEYRSRGEPIDPPTYEVDILGGEKEYHPHTEETIKDAPEEEEVAWREHKEALTRMQDSIQERTALIFLDAIKVQLPKDDKWIKRRKQLFNENIPEDEEERLLHYVNNVLLKTPADKNGLMENILELSMSGAPEEVMQAYKDLFRRQMEIQGRAVVKVLETLEGTDEEMVLQSMDASQLGSQGMADDSKPIPKPKRKRQGGDDGPV